MACGGWLAGSAGMPVARARNSSTKATDGIRAPCTFSAELVASQGGSPPASTTGRTGLPCCPAYSVSARTRVECQTGGVITGTTTAQASMSCEVAEVSASAWLSCWACTLRPTEIRYPTRWRT